MIHEITFVSCRTRQVKPSMRSIADKVACENGMTLPQIRLRTKAYRYSHARQEAFRRQHDVGFSSPQIAAWWGYDHTTILYGIGAARKRLVLK